MPAKYNLPVRPAHPRDPQQFRLYRMEVEAIGARGYMRLTRGDIGKLLRSLAKAYRVPSPTVRFADFGDWSAECDSNGVITFNPHRRRAYDVLTVVHEFGHHLHNQFEDSPRQEAHGPQYMACYMSALDTARVLPVCAMRAVCDKWGIQYNDPGERNRLTDLRRAVKGSA